MRPMSTDPELPSTLLSGVAWSLQRPRYRDVASFARAVERFHAEAHGTPPTWQPDAIALAVTMIRFRLAGASQEQTRRSPGPEGFTTAGLLFALHDAMRPALEH